MKLPTAASRRAEVLRAMRRAEKRYGTSIDDVFSQILASGDMKPRTRAQVIRLREQHAQLMASGRNFKRAK